MTRTASRIAAHLVALALLLSPVLAAAQAAAAQSSTAPAATAQASAPAQPQPAAEEKMGRDLGGHLFLPSHLMQDPFSYTAFGTYFGLGAGDALGPKITFNPPSIDGTKWYGYTGLGLGMLLNVRILEFLSAHAGLNTIAYLGTGSGAVFTVGTSAQITGSAGVKGSLPVGEHLRFSAAADISYGPVYSILLANGIVDALNQCRLDPNQCRIDLSSGLQQINTVTWAGTLAGAWAPAPFLGFVGNAQFIVPTKTGDASIAQNGVTLGISGEFDALPLVKWLPVGVNVAYQLTTGVGGNKVPTANDAGFGFYYTGRKDLALGLEIDWKWNTLQTEQTSHATLAWLNFRYYWN